MDLFELDDFLAQTMERPRRVLEPTRTIEIEPLETRVVESVPVATRVPYGWATCLSCGAAAASSEADDRGRFRGVCDGCHAASKPAERSWYRWQVERWRKWSATRFHAELFVNESPDPWQVVLYALGKAMFGFATAPGFEKTPRAGLAELLAIDKDALMQMCKGEKPLPASAKSLLVLHARDWFALWRDTEREPAC